MKLSCLTGKRISFVAIPFVITLGVFPSANAATCTTVSSTDRIISGACVWDKTDVENFTTLTTSGDWSGSILGIFDGNPVGNVYLPVDLSDGADTITFSQPGTDWFISNENGQSLNLGSTTEVLFGISNDGGNSWSSESHIEYRTSSAYELTFGDNGGSVTLTEIDLAPSSSFEGSIPPGSQPVPIPAAVWLFGSGLLGLIGLSRRKRTA